jgi:hypothetical protein
MSFDVRHIKSHAQSVLHRWFITFHLVMGRNWSGIYIHSEYCNDVPLLNYMLHVFLFSHADLRLQYLAKVNIVRS